MGSLGGVATENRFSVVVIDLEGPFEYATILQVFGRLGLQNALRQKLTRQADTLYLQLHCCLGRRPRTVDLIFANRWKQDFDVSLIPSIDLHRFATIDVDAEVSPMKVSVDAHYED